MGSQKLGQPVPESNLVSERKSSAPHPAQEYTPLSFTCTYLPVKGRSVPALRSTSYCSGVSFSFHSLSVNSTFCICCFSQPPSTVIPPAASLNRRPRPRCQRYRRAIHRPGPGADVPFVRSSALCFEEC